MSSKDTTKLFEQLHFPNEFENAIEIVPSLLCGASRTVIWAPSYAPIESAHRAKKSILSAKGLVSLLEDETNSVQIMGRRNWLTDRHFRKHHHWASAQTWRDEFDGVLARIANEDESKPLRRRRVIIAEDESGWTRAEARLSESDGAQVWTAVNDLFLNKTAPDGIQRRAEVTKGTGGDPVSSILRDVFNHADAIGECEVQGSVRDTRYQAFWNRLLAAGISLESKPPPDAQPISEWESAGEIAELLRSLTSLSTERNLKKFLASDNKQRLQSLLYSRMNLPINMDVLDEMEAGRDMRPLLMKALGINGDLIDSTLTGAGLVIILLTLVVDSTIAWGLVPHATRVLREALRPTSLVGDAYDANNQIGSIYYLCFGTLTPTRKQYEELRRRLIDDFEQQSKIELN